MIKNNFLSFYWLALTVTVGFFFGTSCSTTEKLNADSPEGAFAIAQKYEKDDRFEEAISQYNEVANKHPYSKLALEAKIRVGDIHFKRENYIEAQTSYQMFKEFHPRHPKIDYITYQLALSYFHQLPDSIDRDLSIAHKAILYFDEVVQSFPTSEFIQKSKEYKEKCTNMLAEKELYIADFYFVRDMFDSALGRFEGVLNKYDSFRRQTYAIYGAAVSAHRLKENSKFQKFYKTLVSNYPNSAEAIQIKRELGHEPQQQ